jgi:hypothetical protein
VQAEEIFDLGAGDQHRDAIGKTDDYGARNEFYGGTHAGCAQNDEYGARHDGAHVQPVNTMDGDDPGNHDYEGAGGSANLGFRAAEGGDQKSRDHRAVDTCLRSKSRCDSEGHGQRQCDQANRDSGDDVLQKLAQAVFAETDNRLGQPAFVQLWGNGGPHIHHYARRGPCG